jgi:hypothetical protein
MGRKRTLWQIIIKKSLARRRFAAEIGIARTHHIFGSSTHVVFGICGIHPTNIRLHAVGTWRI